MSNDQSVIRHDLYLISEIMKRYVQLTPQGKQRMMIIYQQMVEPIEEPEEPTERLRQLQEVTASFVKFIRITGQMPDYERWSRKRVVEKYILIDKENDDDGPDTMD